MSKIVFIIDGKRTYHAGIKPHLSLAQGLSKLGNEISFYALEVPPGVIHEIKNRVPKSKVVMNQEGGQAYDLITESVDFMFGDDFPPRLKILLNLAKKSESKTVVYSHVFNGLGKFFGIETGIPPPTGNDYSVTGSWQSFSEPHIKNLRSADFIISNSYFTESLNWLLYGVKSDGIIYPPSDISIFKPSNNSKDERQVAIYAGNEVESLDKAIETSLHLSRNGYRVDIFGGGTALFPLSGADKSIHYHELITESELTGLLRNSSVTILTPEWESYGNVGAESLLCGTPVIAPMYQPWMENVPSHDAVRILRRGDDVVKLIESLSRLQHTELKSISKDLSKKVSIGFAAEKFQQIVGTD